MGAELPCAQEPALHANGTRLGSASTCVQLRDSLYQWLGECTLVDKERRPLLAVPSDFGNSVKRFELRYLCMAWLPLEKTPWRCHVCLGMHTTCWSTISTDRCEDDSALIVLQCSKRKFYMPLI